MTLMTLITLTSLITLITLIALIALIPLTTLIALISLISLIPQRDVKATMQRLDYSFTTKRIGNASVSFAVLDFCHATA